MNKFYSIPFVVKTMGNGNMSAEFPFGCFSVGRTKFIVISTDLISNNGKKSPSEFENLELKQENFLAKTLYEHHAGLFVILSNNPTLITEETTLGKIINSHKEKAITIMEMG
jgi:hypothetical protein